VDRRALAAPTRIRRKDTIVKPGIHPEYHEVTAHCACGATWQTHSTKKDVHLDICNNCHPFFTGRQKLIDTEGRVERFNKKFGTQSADALKAAAKAKKAAKAKVN
jgi:large subunit ribosomal protein L31